MEFSLGISWFFGIEIPYFGIKGFIPWWLIILVGGYFYLKKRMEIGGIEFRTDSKYLIHLVLIVLTLAGIFHLLGKHFIHTPYTNLVWVFVIFYLADNVFEHYLGV